MSRSSSVFPANALSLVLTVLILGGAPASAAPTATPAPVRSEARAAAPEATEGAAAETRVTRRPAYGPIASKDPAVRAEVKRLYAERNRVHDETRARLTELAEAHRTESDPDFRWEISQEIAQLKRDLELRSVELGLDIARLNGNERRVAEFEKALDQLTNPDKYRPRPIDPSVQAERMAATDAANGGAR